MHVAIDCRPVREGNTMAGVGHYVRSLVRYLLDAGEDHRFTLFFDEAASREQIGELLGAHPRARAVILPLSRFKRLLPYAYSHRIVASAIAKCGADVYHATTGSLPMGYRKASVITVHDLAIYLHPEWFPGGQAFSRRFVVPASLRRADRILAVSRATKGDLERLFAVPSEKIAVVHEAPDLPPLLESEQDAAAAHGLRKPYILFLGTIEPRKNLPALIRAYESLALNAPYLVGGTELVLAGARGWKSEETYRAAETANRRLGGERVRLIGYVTPEQKAGLMSGCLFFAFPSLYEGFGLPVLEAMRLGVPVISSTAGALPEIAGRGGAMLVDPLRPQELLLAMKHLLEEPKKRAELGARGYERSLEFTWQQAAGETLEVYEAAFKAHAR